MSEEKFERVLEILCDFATAIEAGCVRMKQEINKLVEHELGLDEKVFNILHWEEKEGERLGKFEIASKDKNKENLKAWEHAYNILKTNNANLKNHFGSKSWDYYYWLFDGYPDVIFRKKREKK